MGVTRGIALALALAAAVAVAAVVLGGWQAGWWFKTQNTNRESRLYQHQYGRQVSLRDDISTNLGKVADIDVQLGYPGADVQALGAQRLGLARIACQDAEQVNKVSDLPTDQQAWVQQNCANGDVSETSTLRPTG